MNVAGIVHLAEVAQLDAKFHATLRYQVHKCLLKIGDWLTVAAFADCQDAFKYAHDIVDALPKAAGVIVTIYDGVDLAEVDR